MSELTPEQEAKADLYVKKWSDIGLSTEPANFDLAAEGIYEIYKFIEQPEPVMFTAGSPRMTVAIGRFAYFMFEAVKSNLAALKAFNSKDGIRQIAETCFNQKVLSKRDDTSSYAKNIVGDINRLFDVDLAEKIITKIFAKHFGEQDVSNTKSTAKNDMLKLFKELSFDNEGTKLKLEDVWQSFFKDMSDYYNLRHRGKYAAAYAAYVDFYVNVVGKPIDHEAEFKAYEKPILNSSIVWMADNVFVVCDREQELNYNGNYQAHNESGPSIVHRDGTKRWHINGIELNEKIIMHPETLTIEEIDKESDNDKRGYMIDRLGWVKFIKLSGAKPIDYRENAVDNTVESLWELRDKSKRFIATCPTGKLVSLPVKQDIKSCEEAQLWMGRNMERKYNDIGRT